MGLFAGRAAAGRTHKQRFNAAIRGQKLTWLQIAYGTSRVLALDHPDMAAHYNEQAELIELSAGERAAVDALITSEEG